MIEMPRSLNGQTRQVYGDPVTGPAPIDLGGRFHRGEGRTASGTPWLRWGFLTGWLLIEVTALTLRFDKPDLDGVGTWWSRVLRSSSYFPQIGLTVAAMAGLLGGSDLLRAVRLARAALRRDRGSFPWFFLAHVAAFAGFIGLTSVVCREDIATRPAPGLWVAAWMLNGVVALSLWGAAMIPVPIVVRLARRLAGTLMTGLVVGLLAWWASRLTADLWSRYHAPTLIAAREVLDLFFDEAKIDLASSYIGARCSSGGHQHVLAIAPFCGGYDAFGLLWVFLAAYLIRFRRRLKFPDALLLVPLATAAVWGLVVLRVVALAAIPALHLSGTPTDVAHSQISWLIYHVWILGLILLADRASDLTVAPGRRHPNS